MLDGIKGFIAGILLGIVFFYSLRPKTPYPVWFVTLFDEPWTLLIMFVVACYLMTWEPIVGALLLIITIALFTDMILLTRKVKKEKNVIIPGASNTIPNNTLPDAYDYTMIPNHPFASAAKAEASAPNPKPVPGPALDNIPLEQANYPLYYGLDELPPGSPGLF